MSVDPDSPGDVTQSSPRVSVLISCHNYGRFVGEAVGGVLEQERPVDEVIVIDDGSTDDTPRYLEDVRAMDPRVVVERTKNRGQLAAMIRAIELSTGDLLFFLDADDLFKPGHTAAFLDVFERYADVDYVYGDYEEFGDRSGVHRSCWAGRDHDHGRTSLLSKYGLRTYGGVTSVAAVRRGIVLPLLELPDQWITEWRSAGDSALNHYVSLVGGRKYYRFGDTVRYRVHGGNDHLRLARQRDSAWMMRQFRTGRWVHRVASVVCPGDVLMQYLNREAETTPRLTGKEWRDLVKLVTRHPMPVFARLGLIGSITRQWLFPARRG
ncbi:MAG: glycosyltransferase family 2 protein [Planctomycetota bacterium]